MLTATYREPIGKEMATVPTLRLRPNSAEFGLWRLAPLVISRGLDQVALGLTSLLLARRTGTEEFAPFATLYILYALSGQVADGGLAFAVLRTPSDARIRSGSRWTRIVVNLMIAVGSTIAGVMIGGSTGTVLLAGGWVWLAGSLSYVGRATLQWAGLARRLSRAEAVSALVFFASAVLFVRDADDLLLFGLLLAGKSLLEFVLQGFASHVFSRTGNPGAAGVEWVGQVVTYATANVDYLLIGLLLGPAALSVYAVAFRLASAFSSVVATPLTRSAFVQFANTDDIQRVNDRIIRQIVIVGSAGFVLTAIVSPLLPLVLGPGWGDTSLLTLLLGFALPWRLLLGPTVALGISTGRARSVVMWELVRLVTLASAVFVFSNSVFAVAGAAAAATIASITWSQRQAATGVGVSNRWWLFAASAVVIGSIAVVVAAF